MQIEVGAEFPCGYPCIALYAWLLREYLEIYILLSSVHGDAWVYAETMLGV